MIDRFHRSDQSNRQGVSVSLAISSITDTFGCNLNSVDFLSDAGFKNPFMMVSALISVHAFNINSH